MRATWALHERHETHIAAGDLLVCQVVQTRLERGGGGGAYRGEQRGRNERGREKCASLNRHTKIETSMYGYVSSTSSKK